jgi:hypothetical protein
LSYLGRSAASGNGKRAARVRRRKRAIDFRAVNKRRWCPIEIHNGCPEPFRSRRPSEGLPGSVTNTHGSARRRLIRYDLGPQTARAKGATGEKIEPVECKAAIETNDSATEKRESKKQ